MPSGGNIGCQRSGVVLSSLSLQQFDQSAI
jgi:hypothetical protein